MADQALEVSTAEKDFIKARLAQLDKEGHHMDRFGVDRFSRDIAAMFSHSHEEISVRQLHLEWAVDHWAIIELEEYLPGFEYIFEKLSEVGPQKTNDLDNHSKVIKWKDGRAFVIECQSRNYLFVRKPHSFTIYRYWKRPSKKWEDDEVSLVQLKNAGGTKYNDLRCRAWIATWDGLFGRAEGGMISRYDDFKAALFELESLATELAGLERSTNG